MSINSHIHLKDTKNTLKINLSKYRHNFQSQSKKSLILGASNKEWPINIRATGILKVKRHHCHLVYKFVETHYCPELEDRAARHTGEWRRAFLWPTHPILYMMANNEVAKNNFGSRQTIGRRSCGLVVAHLVPIALLIIAMSQRVESSNNPIEDGNYILGNIWIQVSLIALCLLLSSYLTGLNIGLLSFDKYGLLLMIYNGT
ncbi:MAG: hypothetical protein MHMPM18_004770, partial [Marteilia pararefringens]